MSADLWISVALAIPLAIAANLVTPKAQRWLDERASKGKERKTAEGKKKRAEQLAILQKEMIEVEALSQDSAKQTNQNFVALLKVAALGAFASIYGGIFAVLGEVGRWDGFLGLIGRLGGQVIALMTGTLIFMTCSKALRMNRRVNEFEKYKKETDKLIAELSSDDL